MNKVDLGVEAAADNLQTMARVFVGKDVEESLTSYPIGMLLGMMLVTLSL